MKHIFLSYSHDDTHMMKRLRDVFESSDLKTWSDENLKPGTPSWKNAVVQAIEEAGCLIVILTPSSKKSRWVEEELSYAEAQKIPVFPVLARGDESTSVPFGLLNTQRIDIRSENTFTSEVAKLILQINSLGVVVKTKKYIFGVTMTVYEEHSVFQYSELAPMLNDLWILPEDASTVTDCIQIYADTFEYRSPVTNLTQSFSLTQFAFIDRATRFTFTPYNFDSEFKDDDANSLMWANNLRGNLNDEPQWVFRPFAAELLDIGNSQRMSRSNPYGDTILSTSFLTLWEYSYTWDELSSDYDVPEKGDGHDWRLIGLIDTEPTINPEKYQQKIANVWWLCSDTLQARSDILGGAGKVDIVEGTARILHHAQHVGLSSELLDRLRKLKEQATLSQDSDWSRERREEVGNLLLRFFNDASQEIQRKQKNFIPDPD